MKFDHAVPEVKVVFDEERIAAEQKRRREIGEFLRRLRIWEQESRKCKRMVGQWNAGAA